VGVGEVGIAQALVSEDLPTWAYHAHNSWLDLLARYGVVVLMAALVALVGALVTTAARAISGAVAPLAILITLLVGSIAQPILTWTLPTMWVTALVLVVLAAGPAPSRTDAPAAGGDSSRLGRLPWRA
jgi:O-antigen ligase